ncbi:MAG: hypothetical protein ACU843_05985 [Gammaproteobacteria bacterium]
MKHKILSIALLILFVIAAYVFLIKGVKPFLEDVVSSDLFLVQSDDPAEKFALVSNEKSRLAALQCNQYLRNNYEGVGIGELGEEDYHAWALGNYTYVINTVSDAARGADPAKEKFVCKIQWIEGDPLEFENWEVIQFDYENPQG